MSRRSKINSKEEKVDEPKQENVTYIRNKQIGKYQNLIHFPDYNDASY